LFVGAARWDDDILGIGAKPLAGYPKLRRLRHGDWRAVFEETVTAIDVLIVRHRREVYRWLKSQR